ncbi:aminoglycoside phosphotransferase family protein [Arthrobacter pascens]|uniref:aminoglycoside phosphotransferase family protein n=1 Tax=Arthrobacter pascens TaxID=1677 RepID=UPI0027D7FF98|nr:aminoglycoside phosphotransferase family protein [Arthrobacter pascens]
MPIDSRLARKLVDRQFPEWASLPIRSVETDGWDNRTFRLGEQLTVRLPSGPWYALQVAKEQRWLPKLAPNLPLPIPTPVAEGMPGDGYPYPWSIYRWLDGRTAAEATVTDMSTFAAKLASFLKALREVDPADGPAPGRHNWYRGAAPAVYADEALAAIAALGGEIPGDAVKRVWDHAVRARWDGDPVWFHGDVAAGNLLTRDGELSAVIDFGSSGVGDPACDIVIAWTLVDSSARRAFRETLGVDQATWSRGRGWALWKALINLVGALEGNPSVAAGPRRDIQRLLKDFADMP